MTNNLFHKLPPFTEILFDKEIILLPSVTELFELELAFNRICNSWFVPISGQVPSPAYQSIDKYYWNSRKSNYFGPNVWERNC